MTLRLPNLLLRLLGRPQPVAARGPIQYGFAVCYGAEDRWARLPIENLPPDVRWVKRRLRADATAKVLVRRRNGVSVGYLVPANNSLQDVRSLRIRWTAHNLFTA